MALPSCPGRIRHGRAGGFGEHREASGRPGSRDRGQSAGGQVRVCRSRRKQGCARPSPPRGPGANRRDRATPSGPSRTRSQGQPDAPAGAPNAGGDALRRRRRRGRESRHARAAVRHAPTRPAGHPRSAARRGSAGWWSRRLGRRRSVRRQGNLQARPGRLGHGGRSDRLPLVAKRAGAFHGRRSPDGLPAGHRSGRPRSIARGGSRQGRVRRRQGPRRRRAETAGTGRLRQRAGLRDASDRGVVLQRRGDDACALAERGLRPHRRRLRPRRRAAARPHGQQDGPIPLRRRPPDAMERRQGRDALRLLVLRLGRFLRADRLDRHREAGDHADAAFPQLRLPQGAAVLRRQSALGDRRARRVVSRSRDRHSLLLPAVRPGRGDRRTLDGGLPVGRDGQRLARRVRGALLGTRRRRRDSYPRRRALPVGRLHGPPLGRQRHRDPRRPRPRAALVRHPFDGPRRRRALRRRPQDADARRTLRRELPHPRPLADRPHLHAGRARRRRGQPHRPQPDARHPLQRDPARRQRPRRRVQRSPSRGLGIGRPGRGGHVRQSRRSAATSSATTTGTTSAATQPPARRPPAARPASAWTTRSPAC